MTNPAKWPFVLRIAVRLPLVRQRDRMRRARFLGGRTRDGPLAPARRGEAPRSPQRPPLLALVCSGVAGAAGLATLGLLLGRPEASPPAPQAAAAPPQALAPASLEVGQVISPIIPD